MADANFISIDAIKANSYINDNVDDELIKTTLTAMQDLYLQDILGTPMYEDMISKINADNTLATETAYKNLINNYIKKVLIWYVVWDVIDPLRFRMMNKGVMIKNGESSTNADYTEARVFKDNIRIKAEKYAEKLTKYLNQNTDTFPKFKESTFYTQPKISNYSTGIYLGDK